MSPVPSVSSMHEITFQVKCVDCEYHAECHYIVFHALAYDLADSMQAENRCAGNDSLMLLTYGDQLREQLWLNR